MRAAFCILAAAIALAAALGPKPAAPPAGVVPDFTGGFVMVSYNVENLFDTINDPNTDDDEFTPGGGRHWNSRRYWKKLASVWKAIAAANLYAYPDIVGLCEVENRAVVEQLLHWTPLWKGNYSILHKDSPDRRGIDVALLYNPDTFRLLDSAFIAVDMPGSDEPLRTRDILYAKGLVAATGDTLHVFLNHWPSKYGGEGITGPLRNRAASILRGKADSIMKVRNSAKIICMGDFNESPFEPAVNEYLGAETGLGSPVCGKMYNISYYLASSLGKWSYWFQGKGELIDQVVVSGAMLGKKGMRLRPDNVLIGDERMFFDKDGKVFRTYQGPVYKGGVSDHLPVIINIDLQ